MHNIFSIFSGPYLNLILVSFYELSCKCRIIERIGMRYLEIGKICLEKFLRRHSNFFKRQWI